MSGTIALVDDDEDVLQVLEFLLQSVGHTVRLYPPGSPLLVETGIDQIDCVIIDQNMPGKTGSQVLLEIERRRPRTNCSALSRPLSDDLEFCNQKLKM